MSDEAVIEAAENDPETGAGEPDPAGEIILTRRHRVGARVAALSGTVVGAALGIAATLPVQTVSSHPGAVWS